MSLGNRIRKLRNERGISQLELSERVDVSRQTLSKWENDIVLPDVDNLIKLSYEFGVSTDFLLGLESGSEITSGYKKYQTKIVKCKWERLKEPKFLAITIVLLLLVILTALWGASLGSSSIDYFPLPY